MASAHHLAGSIFLLPNYTFFAELLVFLIVLGTVAKLILPPVQRTLAEREQLVRGSLRAGDESQAEAQRLEAEREALLGSARAEARQLLEEARQRADLHRGEVRARAEAERERILAEASAAVEAERPGVRAEAMADVERLVLLAAEQVVGRPVDPAAHREVVEAALRSSALGGR